MAASPKDQWASIVKSKPGTVLVVDDEADICESLQMLLENALPGVRVLTSTSPQEALEMLRTQPVDLIIADYRMPGMDGLEFLRQCAAALPKVPRIMVTAFPDLEIAIRAVNEAGVSKFLTKPIKPDITEYVRVALMDRQSPQTWDQPFAMKLPGRTEDKAKPR